MKISSPKIVGHGRGAAHDFTVLAELVIGKVMKSTTKQFSDSSGRGSKRSAFTAWAFGYFYQLMKNGPKSINSGEAPIFNAKTAKTHMRSSRAKAQYSEELMLWSA
jgi:hypothetical protein